MMKSKKVLSSLLAALMLVSMLTCFTLPAAVAEEVATKHYYVSTANEWNAVADKINGDTEEGRNSIIHIQNDISFKNDLGNAITLIAIGNFRGTLDGHGYKFTDISVTNRDSSEYGARLIKKLYGTIQNLTLDATCNFKNTSTSTSPSGAFATAASGAFIKKCASYATYTAGSSSQLGGFVGVVNSNGIVIDGCIFGGKAINNSTNGTANGFIGTVGTLNAGASAIIKHSVMLGTAGTGTDVTYFDNSYAVLASGSYGGNASITKTDLKEVAWTINNGRTAKEGTCEIYLNVDPSDVLCFGDENNRVVRVEDKETGTYTYYAPRSNKSAFNQTQIPLPSVSGKTTVVTGAECYGEYIYVGNSDITVSYVDTTAYKLQQTREQLTAMVDAYTAMREDYKINNKIYFTKWTNKNAWLTEAMSVLENSPEDIAALQAQIDTESGIDGNVVEMTEPEDYPSVKDYNTYKYIDSIKDYKVEDAEAWLTAVDLSNSVKNRTTATDFSGITLHLTADINMDSEPMKPLCYGWVFDGHLDGHGFAFKNIKIEIDSPYGPVGLIGNLGKTKANARTVQNVGIESGTIKVTGWPRYKSVAKAANYQGNCVGGIVGQNFIDNSLIRKCWNNADISVENAKYVGGILGDGRKNTIIDSCFNLGKTNGYGILGYGHITAITCNSMSGSVQQSAVLYRANLVSNETDAYIPEERMINICGIKTAVAFDNFTTQEATEKAWRDAFNAENTVFSNAAAAWKVNANYAQQSYGNGERIYYTLNENGGVRFGKADGSDQIYRFKMVCDQHGEACTAHPTRYTYGAAGRPITLGFDIGANYYACKSDGVTIKGNVLTFSNEAKAEDQNTFTVYVNYDADRGNVNGKSGIDILDALDALKMVVNLDPDDLKPDDLKTADVNSNHGVDINDAYQIIRHALFNNKSANYTPAFIPGNTAEKKSDYLKVLSYNVKSIWYNPYAEGGSDYPMSRWTAVMSELKAIDADIIGLQEINKYNSRARYDINGNGRDDDGHIDQMAWIKRELGGTLYSDFFVTIPDTTYNSDGGYGHGVISKYPILESDGELFTGKGQMDDSNKRLDAVGEARGFSWHRIDVDNDGRDAGDILFYNCHLAEYSAAQLQYVAAHMNNMKTNYGLRIVCTGDLNLAAYDAEDVLSKAEISVTALNDGNACARSMIDNILVSKDVEYFKFGEIEGLSAAPGLNTRTQLYKYVKNPYRTTTEEQAYMNKSWAASDHPPIWAYIKK